MELICPSCEARYAIPDGSIGEKGRQVSCMNCGHRWHAYPPLELGAAQAIQTPSTGMQWGDPAGNAQAPAWQDTAPHPAHPTPPSRPAPPASASSAGAFAAATGGHASGAPEPATGSDARTAASRNEQLLEIRETLAQIQSEERAASVERGPGSDPADAVPPVPEPEDPGVRAEASPTKTHRERPRRYTDDATPERIVQDNADEEVDLLRRRMEQNASREIPKPTDARRIRKRHDRKARRKKADAAGSGAFLTGFLLITIVASVLIALYLLAPQISERMPAAEQPLNEYVATIDGLRVSIAETWQSISAWVSESLEGKF